MVSLSGCGAENEDADSISAIPSAFTLALCATLVEVNPLAHSGTEWLVGSFCLKALARRAPSRETDIVA